MHCGNLVTMYIQPCDYLATTLSQPCDSFKIQGCAKVVTRLHCGNLVTMFGQPCANVWTTLSQPCDSFKIQGCAKVVPRLCQGCKKALWQPCIKVVTTLSFLYGKVIRLVHTRFIQKVGSQSTCIESIKFHQAILCR